MSDDYSPCCRNCRDEIHRSYVKRYDGYCLPCWNAGVPDLRTKLAAAEAERERLRAALEVLSKFGAHTDVQHGRVREIAREALEAKGTVK